MVTIGTDQAYNVGKKEISKFMIRSRTRISFLIITILAASVALTSAQVRPPVPRPSQKGAVMQTIGTTDVSIAYSRPAVKGRKIWGDWPTPVAGEATLDNQNTRPAG